MLSMLARSCDSRIYRWNSLRRCLCSVRGFESAQRYLSGHASEQKVDGIPVDDVKQYDVAIVGGGMVGMALACSIATNPLTKKLSLAIIDRNPALSNGIRINKDDPPDRRVWDHVSGGFTRYNARDVNSEVLGREQGAA